MDDLPTPTWSGSFRLYGVDVKCHTLSDGRRIIEADSLAALLEAMASSGQPSGQVHEFGRWRDGDPIN